VFYDVDDDSDSDMDDEVSIKLISTKLEDLTTCNSLVSSHGGSLQKAIGDFGETRKNKEAAEPHLKSINEKAQLFRITSNAMVNVRLVIFKNVTKIDEEYG